MGQIGLQMLHTWYIHEYLAQIPKRRAKSTWHTEILLLAFGYAFTI